MPLPDPSSILKAVEERFPTSVLTVDSHTAGEPTRLILGGVGPVPGDTMKAKRAHCMEHLDDVRLRLVREPRGHRDLFAALATEPVTPGAHFGLIYMDARRYPFLCGHATMGAASTLLELGAFPLSEPETVLVVDTPSGPMEAKARVRGDQVESVAVRAVPSFVHATDQTLEVPGRGSLRVDTVCVGGFFAMVDVEEAGLSLEPRDRPALVELGMAVIRAANEQLAVSHPLRPEVSTVDVTEFYEPPDGSGGPSPSVVVYGESHMDRSPCGTGTAAKLTLFHHKGLAAPGQIVTTRGPLGTAFQASIVQAVRIGERDGVVVEIRGSAHMTGVHRFVLDPRDPFPRGFLL